MLPCASLALHVTVVGPDGNIDPLAGVQLTAAPVALAASTVACAGAVAIGLVGAVTVTVNDAAVLLPCASVALQVTVVAPTGNVDPLAGVHVVATAPSSASVAEAVKVKTAPVALIASTVAFAGTVTTGPVVSVTVTVNDAAPMLPCASVAVHVTVVAPSGKVDPLAGVHVVATTPSSASVADAVKVKTAPAAFVASTVAFAGTITTGPVVSVTVTVNDAALVLPCASVALHVTVVAPNGNVAPLAGAQLTAALPSSRSVADAV